MNISFTSKISFVDSRIFRKEADSLFSGKGEVDDDVVVSKDPQFAENVRTCTAGCLVNDKNENAFFHFYHYQRGDYWETTKETLKNFNTTKGLIIGAKSNADPNYPDIGKDSIKVFEEVEQTVDQALPNVSIFKNYRYSDGSTDILYNPEKDEYLISSDVDDISDLERTFKEISIAPNDELFVNGKKISPKSYPSIFR